MRKLTLVMMIIALLAGFAVLPVSAQDDGDGEALPTIAELVASSAASEEAPEFTILLAAVEAADLGIVLGQGGPYTVFAPTDEAFAAALEALEISAEDLLGNEQLLISTLLYHIVPGTFDAETVVAADGASVATSLWGSTVDITIDGDSVMVDGATVVTPDVQASNGIVHIIDSVLLPDEGEGTLQGPQMESPQSIGEIVVASTEAEEAEFTTLLAAAEAAGLVDALVEGGPYTVFAPTDEAFAAALDALGLTAEELLEDTDTLTGILSYHILPHPYFSTDLSLGAAYGTLAAGQRVVIAEGEAGVTVNNANIVTVDITANNGVVHVIDAVLLPAESE